MANGTRNHNCWPKFIQYSNLSAPFFTVWLVQIRQIKPICQEICIFFSFLWHLHCNDRVQFIIYSTLTFDSRGFINLICSSVIYNKCCIVAGFILVFWVGFFLLGRWLIYDFRSRILRSNGRFKLINSIYLSILYKTKYYNLLLRLPFFFQ